MKKINFRQENIDIFESIKNGRKKIETRAATPKFIDIKVGDDIECICGKDTFVKKVKEVEIFKSIPDLLERYEVGDINPFLKTAEELKDMYYSFPDYKEKIDKYGLIAFELI